MPYTPGPVLDTTCDTVHGQDGETNQTQSSCQQSSVDTVDCVMMGGRAAGAGAGVDPHHWIIIHRCSLVTGHYWAQGTLGLASCPGEEMTPPTLSRLEEDCINRICIVFQVCSEFPSGN